VRRGMQDGVRYSGAAILAFIITGKVFSPQYLIWLLPFIAVLERPIARRGTGLFIAGCAATLIAPALTGSFPRTSLAVLLAYNVKNAVFLALLALLTFGRSTGDGEGRLRGCPGRPLEPPKGADGRSPGRQPRDPAPTTPTPPVFCAASPRAGPSPARGEVAG